MSARKTPTTAPPADAHPTFEVDDFGAELTVENDDNASSTAVTPTAGTPSHNALPSVTSERMNPLHNFGTGCVMFSDSTEDFTGGAVSGHPPKSHSSHDGRLLGDDMGNWATSFGSIPGRKSVISNSSSVSQLFRELGEQRDDDDDDDNNGGGGMSTSARSKNSGAGENNSARGGGGGGRGGGKGGGGGGGLSGGNNTSDDGGSKPASNNALKGKGPIKAPEQTEDELIEEQAAELDAVRNHKRSSCNLSRLAIQRIPQEVRCFSWLKELLLGDNKIALLPDMIFIQMQSLEVLDLMENRLVTVPRSIFQLRSLKKVLLDHNQIVNLPDEIDPDPVDRFGLPELVEVGLEWNSLQQFPSNFLLYGPKLERIFLSENPGISHLPSPKLLEGRHNVNIRLDNRPMLLKAAASHPIYSPDANVVVLNWNKIYPDRVLEYLYLGSMRTAQCVEVYQDLDIGYVLTAARNLEVVLGPGMKHCTLPFDDLPGEDISHFFETSFKFIDEACANKRGILIHCFAGLSRSVAMTIGFLMKKYGIGADDGLALVRQSRPSAHPNAGFVASLRQFQKELGISPEQSKRVLAELEQRNAGLAENPKAKVGH